MSDVMHTRNRVMVITRVDDGGLKLEATVTRRGLSLGDRWRAAIGRQRSCHLVFGPHVHDEAACALILAASGKG